jgi:hypothetical protein
MGVRVRLTRKLAERIDGVDLSDCHVGDALNLPPRKAQLLIAEEWATPDERRTRNLGPPRRERRHEEIESQGAP